MVLSMSPSAFSSVYIRNPQAVDVIGILTDDKDQSKGYHSVVVPIVLIKNSAISKATLSVLRTLIQPPAS